MKKSVLSVLGLISFSVGIAQQNSGYPKVPLSNNHGVIKTKKYLVGNEPMLEKPVKSSRINSQNGTVIGTTTYDLQTNSSSQNRLIVNPDGTVSATWTYSTAGSTAAPDRGTGYAFQSSSGWSNQPNARIETERGGWPSILSVNGGEYISHHNTQSEVITSNSRATAGTGSWTETDLTGNHLIWNRTAVGGPNGNTIHMIAVTAPTANAGQLYQGLDGALVYSRSLDGGATWDIRDSVLPGMTVNEFTGFSGDSYAITADGNNVAFVSFGEWADAFMMKSSDNGATWTKTIINDFPIDFWVADDGSDYDNDGTDDTLYTTDGAGTLILDNAGDAHVFFGLMRVFDDASAPDDNSTYFPYTNALLYWNESMGTGTSTDDFSTISAQIIAQAEDLDGDGFVQEITDTEQNIALYYVSLAGIPSASYDPVDDVIYVGYQSYMENTFSGSQSYRHIYLTNSNDGGCTWSTPTDLTNKGAGYEECVFVSMAQTVDDSIRLIYQEDNEPGLAIRGDEDGFSTNEIVYIAIHKDSISPSFSNEVISSSPVACAGDSFTISAASTGAGISYLWSNGSTENSLVLNSETESGTYTVTVYSPCGDSVVSNPVSVTIYPPAQAPTVTYNGDGTYTASGTNITSYQWYVNDNLVNGATGSTFNASTIAGASIKVEVTDNNGCTASSAATIVGITEHPVIGNVSIYPNPAKDVINVSFTNTELGAYTIELFNLVGQKMTSKTVSINQSHLEQIDLNNIAGGIYQVIITQGDNQLTQKVVVQ